MSRVDRQFLTLVHESSEIVKVVDSEGKLKYANPAFGRVFGYDPEEAVASGMDVFDHVHPDDATRLRRQTEEALAEGDGATRTAVYRFQRADGCWRWIEGVATYMLGNPDVRGIVVNLRDITERTLTEESLRESEGRLRQFLDQIAEALLIHDEEGRMVDCNAEACRSLGYTREELLGMSVKDFATGLLSREERQAAGGDTLWMRAVSEQRGGVVGYHRGLHRRKDGSLFPVEVAVGSVEYGGRRLILATCRDVTEHRRLEKELEYQALHDPLTGLLNRRPFMERLERSLERSSRDYMPVSLLFIDLDDFKLINDNFGHAIGDLALTSFANRLRKTLRPHDDICRLGGEEFVVLLETDREGATTTAERLLRSLEIPLPLDNAGRETLVRASIGIACSDTGEETPEELLHRADQAMYQAKARGKGVYHLD